MTREVIIIDDEADIRELVAGILEDAGFTVATAASGLEGIELLRHTRPQALILDVWLGVSEFDGIRVLETIKQEIPDLPVIMISGHGTVETAVQAIKKGAYDFIEKPFKADKLLILLQRAIEHCNMQQELARIKERQDDNLIAVSNSQTMSNIRRLIAKAAVNNSRVLINGPTGSGKERVAREIHHQSKRPGSFIKVNCAICPQEDLSVYFYGKEIKGEISQMGVFDLTYDDTVYIDEVDKLPGLEQAKLAKVLTLNAFNRVDGLRQIKLRPRIIASVNADETSYKTNLSNELLNRLSVSHIALSPLASHPEDIIPLANFFVSRLARKYNMRAVKFSLEAEASLLKYRWPGNIRQLENTIEWIMLEIEQANRSNRYPVNEISKSMIPIEIGNNAVAITLSSSNNILDLNFKEAKASFEKEYINAQLARFEGNISKTANFICMERSALHRKIKAYEDEYLVKK